jgi:hypothetical protein
MTDEVYKRGELVAKYVHTWKAGEGFKTKVQYGRVEETSPAEQAWVAVWWDPYVGTKEMMRKDMITRNPDPNIEEYFYEPRSN